MTGVSLVNQGVLQPYFQPILSLDHFRVIGYEALGRKVTPLGEESLGPYFANPDIHDGDKRVVDRALRRQALAKLSSFEGDCKLFLNVKPSWIYDYRNRPDEIPTLRFLEELGVDGSRIVLELTEDQFDGELSLLHEVLSVYRSKGCQIAIDDMGIGFSNFDRVAFLEPEYMKIDLHFVRNSRHFASYRSLLQAFSSVAEHIGSSLLLEGIETESRCYRYW